MMRLQRPTITLRPQFLRRVLPALVVAAVGVAVSMAIVGSSGNRFLTVNPSVSQRFVAVPSESSLLDLCIRLRRVQGVTGVSYRDYSPGEKSALVTVFYNPQETSVRQLKIFMLHTRILWSQEMKA